MSQSMIRPLIRLAGRPAGGPPTQAAGTAAFTGMIAAFRMTKRNMAIQEEHRPATSGLAGRQPARSASTTRSAFAQRYAELSASLNGSIRLESREQERFLQRYMEDTKQFGPEDRAKALALMARHIARNYAAYDGSCQEILTRTSPEDDMPDQRGQQESWRAQTAGMFRWEDLKVRIARADLLVAQRRILPAIARHLDAVAQALPKEPGQRLLAAVFRMELAERKHEDEQAARDADLHV